MSSPFLACASLAHLPPLGSWPIPASTNRPLDATASALTNPRAGKQPRGASCLPGSSLKCHSRIAPSPAPDAHRSVPLPTATAFTQRPALLTPAGAFADPDPTPHISCAATRRATASETSRGSKNFGATTPCADFSFSASSLGSFSSVRFWFVDIPPPKPCTPSHDITARFLVVLHRLTVPSSLPVTQVSGVTNAHDSSCPAPGAGRKMSCESSATFQKRHVRSLPTVTTRSRRCGATHITSDWCPNSVSTYAMSSRLHTLSVRSAEPEKSWPVPSRIARDVTAPR
mmetsp:Transcript_11756/g.50373  ORF Transcript_11756/g.50373 Transcript_11756/m.50373 type:complete len:286 (-) Transcript_11756:104-961(-)